MYNLSITLKKIGRNRYVYIEYYIRGESGQFIVEKPIRRRVGEKSTECWPASYLTRRQ